jgi:hypothetical protein
MSEDIGLLVEDRLLVKIQRKKKQENPRKIYLNESFIYAFNDWNPKPFLLASSLL